MGVFPATLCAFFDDQAIDEQGLFAYLSVLARTPGLKGLTCNGHTGEIMSLRPPERAKVTMILRRAVDGAGTNLKVISGVSAEGSLEAIDHAHEAQAAGADAILLMPPHHWLRFGRSATTAVGFIEDVAAAGMDIVIHQYPAWTKAGYSLDEMKSMVHIPQVKMIKMGTRDMARWLYDFEQLKAINPDMPIVTCHDEFLLPTLLEAGDGALIGFGGFAPELMMDLVHACLDGDLPTAKAAQRRVAPLARLIYAFGEPGCGAHQRMKVALWLMGRFPSPHFRRPVRPLSAQAVEALRQDLRELALPVVN